MAGEKTEKATPKKRKDERKKGNVFLSKDAVTAVSLITTFYGLKVFAPTIFSGTQDLIKRYISLAGTKEVFEASDIAIIFTDLGFTFLKTAMPLVLISVLVAIVVTMAQTKLLFSAKAFAPKFNRINPFTGIKKMFSVRAVVELLKSLFKIIVLLYVVYTVLIDEVATLPALMDMTAVSAMSKTGGIIMDVALKSGIAFVFLAAADYLYQWWDYEKNMKMSKQEIKDEYKQVEGNPQIKGRQRNLQQQRSRQRMMQNVPEADVVIRNPTHFAVALKFDREKDRAP
ncbi:MAG: EscU/YscU/HrcU family type III secretion system export apparatus switch protein, partial [Clostridia bacterium]|nr:EscU/YscU/HrcU family type III secretion system export apparatus switch protein [Clostridia bacterium]